MAGGSGQRGVSVTARALSVLAAFDEEHRALSLGDIAERASLPGATAHRLVAELSSWGALSRNSNGHYVIGRRLWALGLLSPVQTGLSEVAMPFLNDIHAATWATVHIAVREGTQVRYVARHSGSASVPIVSTVGSTLPLHATAVGKVLLAYAPEEVREQAMDNLQRVTPRTVINVSVLSAQLERILKTGYTTTSEEMSAGAASVAVPIRRRGEEVVAAVGVVVPDLRDEVRLVAALEVAAQGIGRMLV